jgi:glycosyltransferase involved in cell wall biosynthesis
MVDPFDSGAMARAIERLIDDTNLRQTLRERGLKRAMEFDWRETARLTLKAYERAVKSAKEKGTRL